VHLRFVISHAGENDDRDLGVNFADERGQSNAVNLGHFEVDDDDIAIVMGEPGGSFKAVG